VSLTWTDHRYGNGCTAEVGRVGKLIIEWDATYKVRIFDHFMRDRFVEREEAKKWAENRAKVWLSQALEEVNK
jgi:hypothetical protein